MKTIREIANELGVDKQKVYRFIKQNHINEAHHEALQRSGVKYYDEAAETLIKQGFSDETASSEAHHEAHQNRINEAVFDAVIEMLQKELEIKNEQIKELNERLSECSDPGGRGRAGADSGSFAGAGRYAGEENGVEGRD